MKRIVIVDVSIRLIFHAALVGAAYFTFAGHNQPGGGFVGGLVAGAAIALRYIQGGVAEVRSISSIKPWTFLGGGLLLAATMTLIPLLVGDSVMEAEALEFDLASLGHFKLTSVTFFDMGVALLVVGLVFMVFEAFGDEPEPTQIESASVPSSGREVQP